MCYLNLVLQEISWRTNKWAKKSILNKTWLFKKQANAAHKSNFSKYQNEHKTTSPDNFCLSGWFLVLQSHRRRRQALETESDRLGQGSFVGWWWLPRWWPIRSPRRRTERKVEVPCWEENRHKPRWVSFWLLW